MGDVLGCSVLPFLSDPFQVLALQGPNRRDCAALKVVFARHSWA